MTASDFTTTLLVDQTPKEVFQAVNNVCGWWSEEIEGAANQLGDEFSYHYKDLHRCKMKLIEVVPDQKVVWQVMENHFSFTQDASEWTGTQVVFEITKQGDQTQLRFTHRGLTAAYECFDVCSNAWTRYIQQSLFSLIVTGKGRPNPLNSETQSLDYQATIVVNATPEETFRGINDVTKWWTENLEGDSHHLNDEFSVRFGDVHYSKHRVVELVPNQKVVWLVTDSQLNFVEQKKEWTSTVIVFDVQRMGDQTQIQFTHVGLVPENQCFNGCSKGWDQYIKGSLYKLLTEGKGAPGLK